MNSSKQENALRRCSFPKDPLSSSRKGSATPGSPLKGVTMTLAGGEDGVDERETVPMQRRRDTWEFQRRKHLFDFFGVLWEKKESMMIQVSGLRTWLKVEPVLEVENVEEQLFFF